MTRKKTNNRLETGIRGWDSNTDVPQHPTNWQGIYCTGCNQRTNSVEEPTAGMIIHAPEGNFCCERCYRRWKLNDTARLAGKVPPYELHQGRWARTKAAS